MHEMSIAVGLMDQVLDVAKSNQLIRIDSVEIETGYLRQVIPEVMLEAFNAVKQDTIAESATLKIREIKPLAECQICQKNFAPEPDNFLCPKCQKADTKILQGNDIILKSVVGDHKEEKR